MNTLKAAICQQHTWVEIPALSASYQLVMLGKLFHLRAWFRSELSAALSWLQSGSSGGERSCCASLGSLPHVCKRTFHSSGHCVLTKPYSRQRDWVKKVLLLLQGSFSPLFIRCVLISHWPGLGYMVTLSCTGSREQASLFTTLKRFFFLVSLFKMFFLPRFI